jgi:hypothetical protein
MIDERRSGPAGSEVPGFHSSIGAGPHADTSSVRVCPHCAEELADEATVCPTCHKDPAVAPAWTAPKSPDESGPLRLDDVWGPNGVLPTSDRVPSLYYKPLEHAGAGVPPKVLLSLLLALGWGLVVSLMPLSWVAELILRPAGYVAGLVIGIRGRGEALDRLGRVLAELAIVFNAINLAWTVYGLVLWFGVSSRG